MRNEILSLFRNNSFLISSLVTIAIILMARRAWTLPPLLGSFKHEELRETRCYANRMSRDGIEPQLDRTKLSKEKTKFIAAGQIIGPAKNRRIIYLNGRIA